VSGSEIYQPLEEKEMPNTQRGFKLPPDVSVRKERLSGVWVYVFRHTQLGDLGRIILQGRPDGRTHVTCEVTGDADDPMTEKRAAIFKPLGIEMTRQLDIATGGTGEEKSVSPLPWRPSASPKQVATELIQCEKCGTNVALLIFADDAIDLGGLEDYARLMYLKVVELNVPTWVIGPPIDGEPSPDSPADILKIWPEREALCQLRPDDFNPIIEALATTHCRIRA